MIYVILKYIFIDIIYLNICWCEGFVSLLPSLRIKDRNIKLVHTLDVQIQMLLN